KARRVRLRSKRREHFPNLQPERGVRFKTRDVFGSAVEQINSPFAVCGNETAYQAVDNPIAEGLEKRHRSRGLLKFSSCFSPTLSKEVREERHRTEIENAEADDVLQRRQIDAGGRKRYVAELSKIE